MYCFDRTSLIIAKDLTLMKLSAAAKKEQNKMISASEVIAAKHSW
jgi:hypothetical protein